MLTINIDENGYYAEGNDGTLVDIPEIPNVPNLELLKAYKYNDGALEIDEIKYAEIASTLPSVEIENTNVPSLQERLEVVEELLLEMLGDE